MLFEMLTIREVSAGDEPALESILGQWLGREARHALDRLRAESTEAHVVAVDAAAGVVGVMGLEFDGIDPPLFAADDVPCGLVTAYVDRAHRGTGVGTALADYLERVAFARGCTRLVVVSGSRSGGVGYPFWASRYGAASLVEPDRFGPDQERVAWSVPLVGAMPRPRPEPSSLGDLRRQVRLSRAVRDTYDFENVSVAWPGGRNAEVRTADWHLMLRTGESVWRAAAALTHLEDVGHPAARIRPASGVAVTSFEGQPLVLVSHIPGCAPAFEADSLREVGAALGRLHALGECRALPMPTAACELHPPPAVDRAQMLPSGECRGLGLEQIRGAKGWLGAVVAAADAMADDFADCPSVLLHGDAHPWNAVITGDGTAVYIDWESAGPGSAIVDLGFLLLSAAMGPVSEPPLELDLDRARAAFDGYSEHRRLTPIEGDRLADAVRFRALVFVIGRAAEALRSGETPEPDGWWERCAAAETIAAAAVGM